jgi:predicted permease
MHNLWADLRYSFRSFRKAPVFTAVAVLSLALGIGANTAIFTLLDQVLLRMLPVKDPQQLVLFTMRGRHYGSNWGGNMISYPMYRDFENHNEVFSGMFARRAMQTSLMFEGKTERVSAELVSGTFFPVLGVGAFIGRTFTPDDDRTPGGHPIVVLAYDYWQTRFAGERQILGKTVAVNGHNMTVVGVAQQGFTGVELGFTPSLYIPIKMQKETFGNPDMLTDRRTRWVNAFGRMKPGVSTTQAQASLQPFMHSILNLEVQEKAFNNASPYDREQFLRCWMSLLPGSQGRAQLRDQLKTPLWVLMAITGTVLLIACANIANLLLARATGRQKEIAVRVAIGASRGRIVSQLLVESLSLSALGAVAGLALAFWADKLLMAAYLGGDATNLKLSTAPDLRILLFTLSVTVATGLFFGLAPAIQSTNPNVGPTLKDQAGSVITGGNAILRKGLVIAQVTLSLLLLIGAGLFMRSLNNLRDFGPGFRVERLIGFEVDPSLSGYKDARAKAYFQQLLDNVGALPGVQSVGLATVRILENNEWDNSITVEGFTPSRAGDRPFAYMNTVSPGYFTTLGVPMVAGRDFTMKDVEEIHHWPDEERGWMPAKIIVNEKFVKKYFAGRNAVGRHLGMGNDPGTKTDVEIIGVVKDFHYTSIRDDIQEQAFEPFFGDRSPGQATIYVRTALDPNQLFSVLRAQAREMDANVPVYSMRTTEEQISNLLTTERLIASLSAVFGFLATLLAVIGLYGVMAYTVARRTREIGIRMALGAGQGNVIWMVMREVLVLVGIGVMLGVPAAWGLSKFIETQLFGLKGHDPMTMALAALGLGLVACAAGYIPAFRASRVDPLHALRHE